METNQYVTYADLSAAAGVKRVTLYRWIVRGLLPAPDDTAPSRRGSAVAVWRTDAALVRARAIELANLSSPEKWAAWIKSKTETKATL